MVDRDPPSAQKKLLASGLNASSGGLNSRPRELRLEKNLPTELDNSRRVRRRELTEATVTQTVIGALELGMVEGVEGLQPQLQAGVLCEGESLEQRKVPVVTARSAQGVVAKSAPIACSRIRKHGSVVVLDNPVGVCRRHHRMHILDAAVQVRPVATANVVVAAATDVDWQTGLDGDDAGDLPSAQGGLQETVRVVAQNRDAVDEVGGEIVGPVENAGPKVVPPSPIRIGNSIQILTAATG